MKASEFLKFKNWVVIGDTANSEKYAHRILEELKKHDFNVKGVHPKGGSEIYSSLKEVPYSIDIIDLCINSRSGIEYLREAKDLGINKVLIQPGAESDEIIEYCKCNGIDYVKGCALVALKNY